jgi:hypothetical protein
MSNQFISNKPDERRNAPRYPVRSYAALEISNQRWDAHLLDVSATGARIAILDEHTLKPDQTITLSIELDEIENCPSLENNSTLLLSGKIVHSREHIVGIELINNNTDVLNKLHQLLKFFSEMKF